MTTKEAQALLKNPNDKLIAVDMDGVLCHGEPWKVADADLPPNIEMINYINSLYKKGAHIVIYTARFPDFYQSTLDWLIKHGVLFHGINMRIKIGADLYIDDKAINSNDIIL